MAYEKNVLKDIIDKWEFIGEEEDQKIKDEKNNRMVASSYELNQLNSENAEKVFWKRFKTMIKPSKKK